MRRLLEMSNRRFYINPSNLSSSGNYFFRTVALPSVTNTPS